VCEPRAHRLERAGGAYAYGRIPLQCGGVAELATLVVAPTVRVAVARHAAGVRCAGTELRERKIAGDDGGIGAIVERAVAKLSLVVRAPA